MEDGRHSRYDVAVAARMTPLPKFLVVDDVAENRHLLAKTLLRAFSCSLIQECEESLPALAVAKHDRLTAIVVHRAADMDGLELVALLRELNPTVPIVVVSGRDSCPGAIEAGATAVLKYDAWGRIGTLVEETIAAEQAHAEPSRYPFSGPVAPGRPTPA